MHPPVRVVIEHQRLAAAALAASTRVMPTAAIAAKNTANGGVRRKIG